MQNFLVLSLVNDNIYNFFKISLPSHKKSNISKILAIKLRSFKYSVSKAYLLNPFLILISKDLVQ